MVNSPLVSVILPVYNQEKYIAETIDSVLTQSFQDFELIIVDDGSKDKSADIIRHYEKRDSRIRAVYQVNSGRGATSNNGVQKATGKYCAFLDADDLMAPSRLETQLKFHQENTNVHATSCHSYYINDKGKMLGMQRHPGLETVDDCIKVRERGEIVSVAITGLMIEREVYLKCGGLDPKFWPCDDLEFFNRLIQQNYIVVIIQTPLMKYRLHPSAITTRNPIHVYDVTGWVIQCLKARQNNTPEISFADFQKQRSKNNLLVRVNRKMYNYSQIFFRNAGYALMSRHYLNFAWQVAVSAVLSPKHMLGKIRNISKS